MTDYYPPLARAITGLEPNAPGESRRALYERARAALIAKLRGAQPPLLETEITREQSFLEDEIGKGESKAAGHSQGESDPLAELARLIGQTDPFGTMGRAYVEPEPEP